MPPPRGLIQQLDQQLHRAGLLPRRARLLVAVSGGADSVALLRLLVDINCSDYWHWTLIVAHIDHGLRGAASRADARFVTALAQTLHLPCVIRRLKLPKTSSEDTARQARLKSLAAICRNKKCAAVVMAHHADDQAETILMRIFRGTGIDGLAAMSPQSHIAGLTILRPLLDIRRAALRDHLRQIRQPWREDQSNATNQFLRNRIRLQLLPLIESLWPRAVEALCRLALLAADSHAALQSAAREFMDQTPAWGKNKTLQFPRQPFAQLPSAIASEVLRQLIAALGGTPEIADFQRLQEALHILRSAHGAKHIQVGAGISITTDGPLARIHAAHVHTARSRRRTP